jgi:hypothetical protein
MNYAILRVAKRSLGQASAMARHALREMRTPNADPARLRENTIVGPRKAADVVAQLKTQTEPFVKRKDAVRVVELFIGASPEVMHGKDRQQQDAYFAASLEWVAAKFGGRQNVVFAAVHRDETTPHMQVLLTPIVGGKLAANKVLGGPAGLVKLQDEFAAKVGAKHGMRRGEHGSRAKHTTIQQFYAAVQAAGSADALPARVRVPPAPQPLTIFASAAVKEAHAKATSERDASIAANVERERRISELARVGLAVQGRSRRRLPGRLSQVEQLEAQVAGASAVTRQATALLDKLDQAQRVEVISKAREQLASDRAEKAARRPQETTSLVAGPTTRPRAPRPR